jgi:hypothetical protein
LYTRTVAGNAADNKTFLVSPDSGEPRQLHPGFVVDTGTDGVGPIWAPDSRRVLFGSTRKSDQQHGWPIVPRHARRIDCAGPIQILNSADVTRELTRFCAFSRASKDRPARPGR